MREGDEFINGPTYMVVTSDKALDTGNLWKIRIGRREDVPSARRLGIIGGGDLNGRLTKLGAIDEMVLDVESISLGKGLKLFCKHDVQLKLALLASKRIGVSTIQRHYKVVNSC